MESNVYVICKYCGEEHLVLKGTTNPHYICKADEVFKKTIRLEEGDEVIVKELE